MKVYSSTGYYYQDIVRNRLFSKFNYKQVKEIPELVAIEMHITITGLDTLDSLRVQQAIKLVEFLTGKKPKVKNKLSGYVRGTQQQDIVIYSRLANREMYNFFDYLVFVILPAKHKRRYLEEGNLLIGKLGKLYIRDLEILYNLRTNFVDFKETMCLDFISQTDKSEEKRDLLRSFIMPVTVM
jgi:ribosomal protein L5